MFNCCGPMTSFDCVSLIIAGRVVLVHLTRFVLPFNNLHFLLLFIIVIFARWFLISLSVGCFHRVYPFDFVNYRFPPHVTDFPTIFLGEIGRTFFCFNCFLNHSTSAIFFSVQYFRLFEIDIVLLVLFGVFRRPYDFIIYIFFIFFCLHFSLWTMLCIHISVLAFSIIMLFVRTAQFIIIKKHVDTEMSASWVNKSRQHTYVLLATGI